MDDLITQMGNRLFARRKQLRLTQEEIAEKTELTTQTISTAETGRKALRPENIVKLCEALDCSTEYILRGSIAPEDVSSLFEKMQELPPEKYWLLEQIVVNFIEAVSKHENFSNEKR